MDGVGTLSGGGASWRAARIWRAENPGANLRLVFTDTLYEDADTYRFLIEGAANIFGRKAAWCPRAHHFPDYRVAESVPIEEYRGNPEWRSFLAALREMAAAAIPELTWLVEGRDIWEVMRDRRSVVTSQRDPCSETLKRKLFERWLRKNAKRNQTAIIYGIGEHEKHRFDDGKGRGLFNRLTEKGWTAVAPLIGKPEINPQLHMRLEGIEPSRQYSLGYIHDNCGGGCGKGGHAHWQHRHTVQPERYSYDAMMEGKIITFVGAAAMTMLADRRGDNKKKPLSLVKFAERLTAQPAVKYDYEPGSSGCGCMTDDQ